MEDVLEVYHLPWDPDYPVICMDESCKQMVGEVRDPIPSSPVQPTGMDDEYVRKKVSQIFRVPRGRKIEITVRKR